MCVRAYMYAGADAAQGTHPAVRCVMCGGALLVLVAVGKDPSHLDRAHTAGARLLHCRDDRR